MYYVILCSDKGIVHKNAGTQCELLGAVQCFYDFAQGRKLPNQSQSPLRAAWLST